MGLLVRFILHSYSKWKIQKPKAAMKNTTCKVEIFQSLLVYRKLGVSSQYKLACRPSHRSQIALRTKWERISVVGYEYGNDLFRSKVYGIMENQCIKTKQEQPNRLLLFFCPHSGTSRIA